MCATNLLLHVDLLQFFFQGKNSFLLKKVKEFDIMYVLTDISGLRNNSINLLWAALHYKVF